MEQQKTNEDNSSKSLLEKPIIAIFQEASGRIKTAQIIDNDEYMRIFNTGEYIDFGSVSKDQLNIVIVFQEKTK